MSDVDRLPVNDDDDEWADMDSYYDGDEVALLCGIEDPEICESCQ